MTTSLSVMHATRVWHIEGTDIPVTARSDLSRGRAQAINWLEQHKIEDANEIHPKILAYLACWRQFTRKAGKLMFKNMSNQVTFIDLVSSVSYYRRPRIITLIAMDGIRQGGTNSGGSIWGWVREVTISSGNLCANWMLNACWWRRVFHRCW